MTILAGKIITREAFPNRQYGLGNGEENVSVQMSEYGVFLNIQKDEEHPPFSNNKAVLTPAQCHDLGQILLKVAELQPEYAETIKTLDEERKKLEAKYTDMVSGLGLESEIDVVDARGAFKVIESSS